jgi:hypothetical protein
MTAKTDLIQIRPLTLADREILLEMYRTFEPLGGAQGLPPRDEEVRQTWIDQALRGEVNVGAFSAGGEQAECLGEVRSPATS